LRDLPSPSPSSSRSAPSRGFAGSHQRAWLWGRHAVLETLTAGRWPVSELYTAEGLPADLQQQLHHLAAAHNIPIQTVPSNRLEQLCRQPDHQGLAARMTEFPLQSAADLTTAVQQAVAVANSTTLPPLFVMLDRLQDPWNFGAILRCCDAVRAAGVVIGTKSQSSVTPHVARSSSGAINHLKLFQVPSLLDCLPDFRAAGFRIAAASEKSTQQLWDTDLSGPLLLVIGSEAAGVDSQLLAASDLHAAIPMLGQVTSLNAAVAAGILLYECRRRSRSQS
jgi:23S rRNA (guanosine2251-2'-O)-methyltransferase